MCATALGVEQECPLCQISRVNPSPVTSHHTADDVATPLQFPQTSSTWTPVCWLHPSCQAPAMFSRLTLLMRPPCSSVPARPSSPRHCAGYTPPAPLAMMRTIGDAHTADEATPLQCPRPSSPRRCAADPPPDRTFSTIRTVAPAASCTCRGSRGG